MAKLVLRRAAYQGIEDTKVIKKMTNDKYEDLAKSADLKIEKHNREYASAYKKASLYSAK